MAPFRRGSLYAGLLCLAVAMLLSSPIHTPQILDNESSVLLLTAHPDDECMFFSPTLLAFVSLGVHVFALSLSTGNANGLGEIRKAEIVDSFSVLGISSDRVHAVDHPSLQDNITQSWDAELVANVTRPYIVEQGIKHILTFDSQGISSHPNHISLVHGAHRLARSDPDRELSVYTLRSVPTLPFKYAGLLSPLYSHLRVRFKTHQPRTFTGTFVAGWREYGTALAAMRKHHSQLVWFRWLYVLFSRYMWVNEIEQLYP